MTGLSHSTISRIENNEVSPTFDSMIRISKALHMKVWEIFYYDEEGL